MQTVSLLFLPLRRTVSPLKSWSFSMVAGCSETTELSSFTASSTISLLGAFFRSKMTVEKSFLLDSFVTSFFLWRVKKMGDLGGALPVFHSLCVFFFSTFSEMKFFLGEGAKTCPSSKPINVNLQLQRKKKLFKMCTLSTLKMYCRQRVTTELRHCSLKTQREAAL